MFVPFDATACLRPLALWRRRVLERMDAVATQQQLLLRLLARAATTRFGRDHDFARLRSVADFRRAVPLRRYEALYAEYLAQALPMLDNVLWPGRTPYLALSSGTTTGRSKRLPVTRAMVRANRGAAFDVLVWHLAHHPAARPLGGLCFMLGGSTALAEVAPGVREGDLSGIAAHEVPTLLRPWSWPPESLALLADWDEKIARLAAETPAAAIRVLSGTPSWLLMLFERLAERCGTPPLPALELLVHGGVAFAPYRSRLVPYLPPRCSLREVYPASEGFVAIADRGEEEGLRLTLDRGCFFEFVPVAELDTATPTRHWVADLEPGVEYAVVVSNCAGLFGYVLGDTVRFLSRHPPRLVVTGRISWTLSTFGEHLAAEEIEAALLAAAADNGLTVAEYAVGPEFVGSRGRHCWLIELAVPAPPEIEHRLARDIDARLCDENDDYAAHRRGAQLEPPRLILLPRGAFAAWMRAEGRIGGQHKVPRVIADPERFAAIASALLRCRGSGVNGAS